MTDPPPGPTAGSVGFDGGAAAVTSELKQVLRSDQSRLGDVFRLQEEGLSPADIGERLQVPTHGFVYGVQREIEAVLIGTIPAATTVAARTAARVRGLLRMYALSERARSYLMGLLDSLERAAGDPVKQQQEDDAASQATQQAELDGKSGVYVYSLPHYLRHPVDPETRRTLLKVGHSSVDVYGRVGSQSRATALPEDPVLLRIYSAADENTVTSERHFHDALQAADHLRNRSTRAGREWFLTTTRFLDYMAAQFGMAIDVVTDFESGVV